MTSAAVTDARSTSRSPLRPEHGRGRVGEGHRQRRTPRQVPVPATATVEEPGGDVAPRWRQAVRHAGQKNSNTRLVGGHGTTTTADRRDGEASVECTACHGTHSLPAGPGPPAEPSGPTLVLRGDGESASFVLLRMPRLRPAVAQARCGLRSVVGWTTTAAAARAAVAPLSSDVSRGARYLASISAAPAPFTTNGRTGRGAPDAEAGGRLCANQLGGTWLGASVLPYGEFSTATGPCRQPHSAQAAELGERPPPHAQSAIVWPLFWVVLVAQVLRVAHASAAGGGWFQELRAFQQQQRAWGSLCGPPVQKACTGSKGAQKQGCQAQKQTSRLSLTAITRFLLPQPSRRRVPAHIASPARPRKSVCATPIAPISPVSVRVPPQPEVRPAAKHARLGGAAVARPLRPITSSPVPTGHPRNQSSTNRETVESPSLVCPPKTDPSLSCRSSPVPKSTPRSVVSPATGSTGLTLRAAAFFSLSFVVESRQGWALVLPFFPRRCLPSLGRRSRAASAPHRTSVLVCVERPRLTAPHTVSLLRHPFPSLPLLFHDLAAQGVVAYALRRALEENTLALELGAVRGSESRGARPD
ncbi:hypothetical protein ACCO45_003250 [Purpureocillium lilacinum]|uniref:Uncharacterized protein n=1 Tax=Purpureocillium lilacinum TaxID=33203 RepID=A0ACC4E0P3_PURLI